MEGKSLEAQWAAFVQAHSTKGFLSSRSKRDRAHELHLLRALTLRHRSLLLGKADDQFKQLPTPIEAIRIYLRANIMDDLRWETVLWTLLVAVVKLRTGTWRTGPEAKPVYSPHFSRTLLNDTLEVWKLLKENSAAEPSDFPHAMFQDTSPDAVSASPDCLNESHTSPGDESGSRSATATPELAAARNSSQYDPPDGFLSFLPRLQQSQHKNHIFAAAVMTLDQLCPETEEETHAPQAAYEKEFVQLMESLVTVKPLRFDEAEWWLTTEEVPPKIIQRLRMSWESLPQRAMAPSSLAQGPNASADSEPHITRKKGRWHAGSRVKYSFLFKAIKSADVNGIDIMWQTMEANFSVGKIEDQFFGLFLEAYMSLQRPIQATHVWNRMIELGQEPSQSHWLAMFRGCQRAREYTAMEDVWQRMNASGLRPGLRCWIIRIQGLVLSGLWQQALKALDELSKVWGSAASPVTGAETRPDHDANDQLAQLGGEKRDLLVPSIVPVNAAITSLLAIERGDIVPTFIKWAESHKIAPDTVTFNIMLRRAVRNNRSDAARNVLLHMESFKCQPDIHTFTIILNGLFRNSGSAFRSEDSDAQVAAVDDIFRQMKDAGIEPSVHTYSSMLDGLMGGTQWEVGKPINLPAARAVLDHMARKNFTPSPHIYTILISHYFNLDPPDLARIDALWNRMQLDGSPRDHIFYDRMIEGYARLGEVERMLAFLRRMPTEGMVPGWVALHAALMTLVRAKEWDMVRDLVRDVGGRDGVFWNASRYSTGKGDFWDLVDYVRRRGIEMPVFEEDERGVFNGPR
ncbi:Pentatricopeptide repeat [Lasallia pustulata]|uniref:Pentatricopeptide repeat n=1 Tax=Lasallia pustulata TaxID=136370 RepID=A0A1W5DEM9_9LECA|nr:Pentatricopeptide repeat [Lasallia pustulata]